MRQRSNRRATWATLNAVRMNNWGVRMAAARLGALILLAAVAVVPAMTSVGPIMLIFWSGHGFHALDVGLIMVGVPAAVALLRYAELLGEDELPARSRTRHVSRRRWASAKLPANGVMSRFHPDLPVFVAASISSGIGLVLALAASSRSLAVVGGMVMGGAITFLAVRLYGVLVPKDPERRTARRGQTVDEIMVARPNPEWLSFPQDADRETTKTEIRPHGSAKGSVSLAADLPASPEIPSTTVD